MIVVTGATGFVGTYLIDELVKNKFEVIATGLSKIGEEYYDEMGISFIRLNVADESDFDKLPTANIDAVIHLATLLPANVKQYNPRDYINVNIIGTVNMLEYCRKNGINKNISTTTHSDVQNYWQYGKPITEDAAKSYRYTGDHAMYVISKNAAADCVEHYNQQYGMQGIVFRLPAVYGYGPHSSIFVNGKYHKTGFQIFVENSLEGKPLEVWGNPNAGRDMVYVKDVVSAFVNALDSKKAKGLYNIATGKATSLVEQARVTVEVFSPPNKKSKIVFCPEKPSIEPYLYDVTKAKDDFGYQPRYSFKEMMIDYKKEMESERFKHLIGREDKRKNR
jgi:UDP-glucose 4-epimerase